MICCSVAHLYVRLDRGSKAWVNSQDLLPYLIFTCRPLRARDRDLRRNWPRTERRQKVPDAKLKKSVRSALQNTVGRVSRSRDLFLFGLMRFDRRALVTTHVETLIP